MQNTLTAEKKKIIDAMDKGGKKKLEVAKEFCTPSSAISMIFKHKEMTFFETFEDHQGKREEMRNGDNLEVEKCFIKWLQTILDRYLK